MKDWEINEAQLDDMYTVFNASSESFVLGKLMGFVLQCDKFQHWKAWEIKNSIYYAVKHDKYMLHFKKGSTPLECIGFCTWGFFRREEIDTRHWHGDNVYSRMADEPGEVLYFPMFYCEGGAKEVLKFIRNIQKFIYIHYPDIAKAEGWRDYSNGQKRKSIMHIVRSDRDAFR